MSLEDMLDGLGGYIFERAELLSIIPHCGIGWEFIHKAKIVELFFPNEACLSIHSSLKHRIKIKLKYLQCGWYNWVMLSQKIAQLSKYFDISLIIYDTCSFSFTFESKKVVMNLSFYAISLFFRFTTSSSDSIFLVKLSISFLILNSNS